MSGVMSGTETRRLSETEGPAYRIVWRTLPYEAPSGHTYPSETRTTLCLAPSAHDALKGWGRRYGGELIDLEIVR